METALRDDEELENEPACPVCEAPLKIVCNMVGTVEFSVTKFLGNKRGVLGQFNMDKYFDNETGYLKAATYVEPDLEERWVECSENPDHDVDCHPNFDHGWVVAGPESILE